MSAKNLAALFALAALWGASYLFIRVAAPAFGPFPLGALRALLAAALLWTGMLATGRRTDLRPYAGRLLVLGLLNAAAPFVLIGAAELYITASLAAMLTATVPLWGSLFGALWLGERITPRRAWGLVLGLAGVAALVGWSPVPLTPQVVLSIAAMLLAACCYALNGVYVRRRLAGAPGSLLALGQQVAAVAWLGVPALWSAPSVRPSMDAAMALTALAVLSTSLAYLLYFHLIQAIGPTRTTTVTYLIPVFGTLWGALFLREPITGGMIAGLSGVLGSVLLVNEVRLPWVRGPLPRGALTADQPG
jgi:drug/metabolite transporter (DMT)-like permease